MNNNEVLINDLRRTASYLAQNPDFPTTIETAMLMTFIYERAQLIDAAGRMGSFKKKYDDYNFTLNKDFGLVSISVSIRRDQVCKKVVTWDCPDDSALLREFMETAEQS